MRIIRQGSSFISAELGDMVVTALLDGTVDVGTDYMSEGGQIIPAPSALPVWTFHIQSRHGAMLIDTGGGATEPTMGGLYLSMRDAGLEPGMISQIALTHPHSDHMGALMDRASHEFLTGLRRIWVPVEDMALYRKRVGESPLAGMTMPMEQGDGPMHGVVAVQMPGHMAGHMGFLIDGRLLVWGDVVHVPGVQFARPAASSSFDADVDVARATRLSVFDRAVRDGLMVAGSHLEHPAMGWLMRRRDGYAFDPIGDRMAEH